MDVQGFFQLEDITYDHAKTSGIYVIVSTANGKIYIGSAKHLYYRKATHLSYLLKNKHCNRKLQNVYNKYGKKNLIFKILEKCNLESLIKCEQYWIDSFDFKKDLLNLSPTASSCLGVKHTQATREKMSKLRKNRKFTEEHKRKIGLAHKGRKRSTIAKQNISKANKARIYTDTMKCNLKDKLGIKIKMIDRETFHTVKTFYSINDASSYMNCSSTAISSALKRQYGTSCGYIWLYENIEIEIPVKRIVISIDLISGKISYYDSVNDAAKFLKKSGGNISRCLNEEFKYMYGCQWYYGFIIPIDSN